MDKRGAVIENKVHEPQTVVKGHLYGNVKKKIKPRITSKSQWKAMSQKVLRRILILKMKGNKRKRGLSPPTRLKESFSPPTKPIKNNRSTNIAPKRTQGGTAESIRGDHSLWEAGRSKRA